MFLIFFHNNRYPVPVNYILRFNSLVSMVSLSNTDRNSYFKLDSNIFTVTILRFLQYKWSEWHPFY